MGFLKQEVPVIDFETWSRGTRAEKIKPMAKHWAEVGFGTPVALHLFYVVKILLYILVAALFALATTGELTTSAISPGGGRSRSSSRRSCSTRCCSRWSASAAASAR